VFTVRFGNRTFTCKLDQATYTVYVLRIGVMMETGVYCEVWESNLYV